MAVRTPASERVGATVYVTWSNMATGDTIQPWEIEDVGGVTSSVHFSGTFAGGTSMSMEQSNTGTNYLALADKDGNTIASTAESIHELNTAARYVRPTIASGSADSVTATLVLKG